MATYQLAGGEGEIGGVDMSGNPHDPIVTDDKGVFTVPDDQQEYAQTIAHALAAGLIAPVNKRRKDS